MHKTNKYFLRNLYQLSSKNTPSTTLFSTILTRATMESSFPILIIFALLVTAESIINGKILYVTEIQPIWDIFSIFFSSRPKPNPNKPQNPPNKNKRENHKENPHRHNRTKHKSHKPKTKGETHQKRKTPPESV